MTIQKDTRRKIFNEHGALSANEKRIYEAPVAIPLGQTATAAGQSCNDGSAAHANCRTGISASGPRCRTGVGAIGNECSTGSGAANDCNTGPSGPGG